MYKGMQPNIVVPHILWGVNFCSFEFLCNVVIWFFTMYKGMQPNIIVVIGVGIECMCQHNVVVDD
jgi:hypothetical protein